MKDKIVLLTGFTSGIGKATATSLASKGAVLGLVCRDMEKGKNTIVEIKEQTGNSNLHLFVADLSSQKEIHRLAAEVHDRFNHLDVLINNAGAINPERKLTPECIETTFATNHLAYFLLTHLVLDLLKTTPQGRIINLASEVARMGKINFEDLSFHYGYSAFHAYSQSKLANIIFTYELARRLENTGITVNCLHPGVVKTHFGTGIKGFTGMVAKLLFPLWRTPEKGAETVIWLASSDEVKNLTGRYFKDKKEIKSQTLSHDKNIAQRLWLISCKMTSINQY